MSAAGSDNTADQPDASTCASPQAGEAADSSVTVPEWLKDELLPDGVTFRTDYTDIPGDDDIEGDGNNDASEADSCTSGQPPKARSLLATPQWILPSGELTIEEGSDPFFAELARDDELFLQDDRLVEVVEAVVDGVTEANIVPIDHSAFRSRVELVGTLYEYRKRGDEYLLGRGRCSGELAKAMITARAKRRHLKKLRAIALCPIISEDEGGELAVHRKGYLPIRGGLYICRRKPPLEPPLDEALTNIVRVFQDTKFLTPYDRFRAWLYPIVIALVSGRLIPGPAPIHLVQALHVNSGKTFLQDLTAAWFGELPWAAPNKTGGVGGLDEGLAEGMARGRAFIKVDNLELGAGHDFDSEYLEQVMTARRTSARVPYRRTIEVDPRNHFFMINTNCEGFTPGLLRRCWPLRIRKRPMDFRYAEYREGDEGKIIDHVLANPRKYLGSLFAVVREWHRAGKKRTSERRHSFTHTAQVADWIAQNVFQTGCPLFDDYDSTGSLMPAIEESERTYEGDFLFFS